MPGAPRILMDCTVQSSGVHFAVLLFGIFRDEIPDASKCSDRHKDTKRAVEEGVGQNRFTLCLNRCSFGFLGQD